MYKFLLTVALLFISGAALFAQLPSKPTPVTVRRVNGVVRDSLGKAIPAAAIRLISSKDTLHTLTSEYGVFNFREVHSESFSVEVQMAGYHPYFKKYFLNDTKAILVLPPLVLTSSMVQLKGIVVTTEKGPQQRGDTTEFWAKDYIVRDYARLEDMLKRMEGFSTDANGALSYNGKPVSRALFNGTRYFDGDVAAAIRELPADIVERIQVIQDNETGTGARKSMSESSSQTLNIVTKADKSAGKMYLGSLAAGTQDRYSGMLSAKSIDGIHTWEAAVSVGQEPSGIKRDAPLGTISKMTEGLGRDVGGGGSGGMQNRTAVQLNYGDKIGRLRYGINYSLDRAHARNETSVISEEFYKEGNLKKNTTSSDDNTFTSHSLLLYADLQKGIFRMMTQASVSSSGSVSNNFREIRQTGIFDNLQQVGTGMRSQAPSYQLNSSLHFYEGKKVSLQVRIAATGNSRDGSGQDNTDTYSAGGVKPDSSLHLFQQQKTSLSAYSANIALMYQWRKKYVFSLETAPGFTRNADINYRDQLIPDQPAKRLTELSNDNVLLNYRLPTAISVTYSPLNAMSIELRGNYEINWRHSQFRLKELDLSTRSAFFTPRIDFKYQIKNGGLLSASYARNVNLPTLLQLNPRPYYATPFDVTIGSPDLKNGVSNTLVVQIFKNIPRPGIVFNTAFNYSFTGSNIGANRIILVDSVTNTIRTETHYLNIQGGDNKSFFYSLSKNMKPMNTTLSINGMHQWGQQVFLANGSLEQTDQRTNSYSFTALFTPVKWLDLAPDVAYNTSNNQNSLQPGRPLYNNELNAHINAGIYFPADLKINVSARQTITRASSLPVSQHPFVLNANIEKRFLKRKDAIISFMVMDAFQQNNNNSILQTATGYTNAVSNLKSRYFLCQLSWNPQRFTRSKSATGSRRGDGSFVK